MKKLLLSLVCAIAFMTPLTALAQSAQPTNAPEGFLQTPEGTGNNQVDGDRDGFLNDSVFDVLKSFQERSGFRSFSNNDNPDSIRSQGLDSLSGIIYTVVDILKYVVGGIATVIIVISIVRMIGTGVDKTEEEFENVKSQLLYAIIAVIAMVSIDFFFKNVFVIGSDNFLDSLSNAERFALAGAGEIRGIYNFIQSIIGVLAILMMVVAGFRLVANAGDEEATGKLKNQVIYGAVGLIVVAVSEFVVKDVLFIDGGATFSIEAGRQLLVSFTNFISGFIALAAFLSFLYAGYLYVISGVGEDNSEKVKNIVIAGVIGILLAAAAFGLVNTFVKVDPAASPEILQNQLDSFR